MPNSTPQPPVVIPSPALVAYCRARLRSRSRRGLASRRAPTVEIRRRRRVHAFVDCARRQPALAARARRCTRRSSPAACSPAPDPSRCYRQMRNRRRADRVTPILAAIAQAGKPPWRSRVGRVSRHQRRQGVVDACASAGGAPRGRVSRESLRRRRRAETAARIPDRRRHGVDRRKPRPRQRLADGHSATAHAARRAVALDAEARRGVSRVPRRARVRRSCARACARSISAPRPAAGRGSSCSAACAVIAVDNGPLKGAVRDDRLVTHVRDDAFRFRPRRPVALARVRRGRAADAHRGAGRALDRRQVPRGTRSSTSSCR